MAIPLLVLPGALGRFEASEAAFARIAEDRPLAVLDYRADDRFDALLARIAETADTLGGGRFDLLGQSYGGWIAQCAAARWPGRVRRLVLSHSFALEQSDAKYFAIAETILRKLPPALLAPLLKLRIRRALAPMRRKLPELYGRQMAELARTVGSASFAATLASQQRCLRESVEEPGPAGPVPSIPVLIIESDDDPLVGAAARAKLRRRHAHAEVLTIPRAGHISAIVEPDAYSAGVIRFLTR